MKEKGKRKKVKGKKKKRKNKSAMKSYLEAKNQGEGKPRDIKERTFRFSVNIVQLCQLMSEKPGVMRTLAGQLLRAGTSIGANVEESQAGQSRADFVSKYAIALKEARETIYWLRLLRECDNGVDNVCKTLLSEVDEISRIIATIIVNTKNRKV